MELGGQTDILPTFTPGGKVSIKNLEKYSTTSFFCAQFGIECHPGKIWGAHSGVAEYLVS